jgi:hypothetical protein
VPEVTCSADGIPGDLLDVGLVGTRAELIRGMLAALWRPADLLTFDSSLEIAASVPLDRPTRKHP